MMPKQIAIHSGKKVTILSSKKQYYLAQNAQEEKI